MVDCLCVLLLAMLLIMSVGVGVSYGIGVYCFVSSGLSIVLINFYSCIPIYYLTFSFGIICFLFSLIFIMLPYIVCSAMLVGASMILCYVVSSLTILSSII